MDVSRQFVLCRKAPLDVASTIATVAHERRWNYSHNYQTLDRILVDEEGVLDQYATATRLMSLDNSCCVERLPYVLDTVFAVATMTLVAKLTIYNHNENLIQKMQFRAFYGMDFFLCNLRGSASPHIANQ
mmetsp:Transcript_24595/g.58155  ORF Transcript_24595/g.58155 Transcript_24595/m.58155 type:complete len:130 (-) Transcript_24595:177-566(-)